MLVRGFEAVSLGVTSGSEFTKKRRPSSSRTLAMCPLTLCANNGEKNDAEKIAQRASVARKSHPQFVARLSIHHAPAVRHTRHSSSRPTATIIRERLVAVNATSVLCALDLPLRHGVEPLGVTSARPRLGQPKNNPVCLAPGLHPSHSSKTIITTPPAGRGCLIGHFLGQLCLCRQPRPG